MADPMLAAHEAAADLYVISGPLPISIRDQVVRGTAIVDRLLGSGRLRSGPLVVVGAGVGGVAAAMRAAGAGVLTYLLDRETRPFMLQARAASRWLDPTQYDWPLDHFRNGTLPWGNQGPLPLPVGSGYAAVLAANWRVQLASAANAASTLLRYLPGMGVADVRPAVGASGAPSPPEVKLDDGRVLPCEAIIWAAGQREEETSFPSSAAASFDGIPFWTTDALTAAMGAGDRVLISGAGDGALQDLIRIIAGNDRIGELLERLAPPSEALRIVQSAEDRAHRGRAWLADDANGKSVGESGWLKELHVAHETAVRLSLASRAVTDQIDRSLKPSMPCVHLVHRGPYLSSYYGLNRFLALLFDRYLAAAGRRMLHPECEIVSIDPSPTVPHECTVAKGGGGHSCIQRDHAVTFRKGTRGTPPPDGDYNVILVRHGLKRSAPGPTIPELQFRKHLLPYHLV